MNNSRHASGVDRPTEKTPPTAPDRRALGAHYSPRPVVDWVVERTLGAALRQARFTPEDPPRVCDPACGDGVFLRSAAARLSRWLGQHRPEAPARWIHTRIRRAVHGVDVDPGAVAAAGRALEARGVARPHVALGNSLIRPGEPMQPGPGPGRESAPVFDFRAAFSTARAGGRFDVVVGNPPFVDSEQMSRSAPGLRRHLAAHYDTAQGNWDLFCPFVQRALELLSDDGYLGLILPNKVVSAGYAAEVRRRLAAEDLRLVRDYSAVRLFDAAVYPVVVVARRRGAGRRRGCAFETARGDVERPEVLRAGRVAAGRLERESEAGWGPCFGPGPTPEPVSVPGRGQGRKPTPVRGRARGRVPLGELVSVHGAATVAEAYDLAPLLHDLGRKNGGDNGRGNGGDNGNGTRSLPRGALRVVNTGTLDPHRILWGERDMRYLGQRFARPWVRAADLDQVLPRRADQARAPKLVVAGLTRRLEAAFAPRPLVAAKSTTVVPVPDEELGWLLAALLNSRAASEQYRTQFRGLALANGYLRVGPPQLRALEVPDPDGLPAPERARLVEAARRLARGGRGARPARESAP